MRKTVHYALGSLCMMFMICLVMFPLAAHAQPAQPPSGGGQLVGTWLATITLNPAPPGDPPSFPAMRTFQRGGVAMETSASTPYRSPSHGVWERLGDHSYAATFSFFRFNSQGQYVGTARVKLNLELEQDGDTYTGSAVFEIFNPSGALIVTGNTTEEGQRLENAAD